ncbi:MAG: hypothetical protein VYE15_01205, partial [Myxococcota bacterium]|nr:hypothetical protein [Myxococcota bacterium]
FSEPAHTLVAEGLALGRVSSDLPSDCLEAHLRIQGMAASLRGANKLLRIGEAQFLTLADDVQRLREHTQRRNDDKL